MRRKACCCVVIAAALTALVAAGCGATVRDRYGESLATYNATVKSLVILSEEGALSAEDIVRVERVRSAADGMLAQAEAQLEAGEEPTAAWYLDLAENYLDDLRRIERRAEAGKANQ